jgi:hypothetical protein
MGLAAFGRVELTTRSENARSTSVKRKAAGDGGPYRTSTLSILRSKAELCPAALGVVLRFAAVLLIWRLKRAQPAHFLENALGIKLVFQPLECAIYRLTFANEYFWHQ